MVAEWIEENVTPRLGAITNTAFFTAFRGGFFALMPLTIIGSIFMLIANFPVPGYEEFMASTFGEGWSSYISPAYRATFNMMGIIFAGTFSYKLAESYKLDSLTVSILGIVAYVVVSPKTVVLESGETVADILQFDWLGTKGILTAVITSFVAVHIFRACERRGVMIKMPPSVPPMVGKAFAALIPGTLIICVFLVINGICIVFAGSLPEAIFKVIQAPLQFVIGQPWAVVLVAFLNGLLWWFGIHPTVINSMVNPFLIANAATNQSLADAGSLSAQTGVYGTIQLIDQFATIGGAGMTIGLAITMVLAAHSARMKAVSKVAIVPAVFNISEPMIFGVPTIFNPLMLVPTTITPVIACLITMGAQSIGFMPMFTNVQAPWATPFLFSGYLVSGWQGAVVQLVVVIVTVLIYLPFVKALDKSFVDDEAKAEGAGK